MKKLLKWCVAGFIFSVYTSEKQMFSRPTYLIDSQKTVRYEKKDPCVWIVASMLNCFGYAGIDPYRKLKKEDDIKLIGLIERHPQDPYIRQYQN